MKKTLLFFTAIFFTVIVFAQNLTPTDAGSSVKFVIKNFGMTVNGSFTGLMGNIIFNPSNITNASFNVTVKAATINTDNNSRDKHLKKDDYFNVATYPLISFVSTKISNSNKAGTYFVDGVLTIKGTKKNISFPFVVSSVSGGYLYKGDFLINRRDFKVGGSSFVLSDNLNVYLNVFAK